MMQKDFIKPKGWLGMMLGNKLWYSFDADAEDIVERSEAVLAAIEEIEAKEHSAHKTDKAPAPLGLTLAPQSSESAGSSPRGPAAVEADDGTPEGDPR